MKKVVCLACGLVNLDRFTTYPNCAACGARLPEKPTPKWRAFWFQSIPPFYWATTVGLGVAVLGVGAAIVVRDTREVNPKLLMVYLQVPRSPGTNGLLSVRFTLDSTEGNPAQSFDMVRLRFSRELEQNFKLIDIHPHPQTSEDSAVGQYFMWRTLPRGDDLQLTFKPRRSGKLQLKATLAARGYEPFDVQRIVFAPLTRAKKEK